ncbi:hypothetical protein FA13DRAFT_1738277 [Coprinellus micaceus]|uniref:Velvet domain-containing protein n=1 Tax=Coprinellus micaceus TaxID=71717 RepID=A0A4Y7SVB7_COPMI|nr:hypothetical protein FA13DRAFT_1738277 [Coprinellus micaceus]
MFSVADFGSRQPIPFESGQLAHDTTRSELIEIQKADLGRKYARVDRRPLDPPPVVLLKLFHILDPRTEHEVEREITNYDDVQNVGLICTVDLFPIPGHGNDEHLNRDERNSSSSGSSTPARSHNGSDGRYGSDSLPPASIISSFEDDTDPSEVVHYVNNFPVVEGTKVTGALVGQTVVQPNVVEYQGQKALVFVFADLAVKTEGNFIIRYRVFDLYAQKLKKTDDSNVQMQAECYGGPFRVYSTKEFPGLQASTELTKHLARWGVRLNIRETERRRRKRDTVVSESPPYTTKAMKRKWPDGGEGAYHEDDGYASAED